jgi:hypothetical protein
MRFGKEGRVADFYGIALNNHRTIQRHAREQVKAAIDFAARSLTSVP